MKYGYDMQELAKRVRAKAAATIANESSVIQNDERRVQEATEIINLCNMVLAVQDHTRIGSQQDR